MRMVRPPPSQRPCAPDTASAAATTPACCSRRTMVVVVVVVVILFTTDGGRGWRRTDEEGSGEEPILPSRRSYILLLMYTRGITAGHHRPYPNGQPQMGAAHVNRQLGPRTMPSIQPNKPFLSGGNNLNRAVPLLEWDGGASRHG